MTFLKNIWNTFFTKSKKQELLEKTGSISETPNWVIHKKEIKIKKNLTYVENELPKSELNTEVFPLPVEAKLKIKTVKPSSLGKERAVIDYLKKYGSIDKMTCAEKFNLKRLDNLICELRKQGMNIQNETIELHNELGEKVKVNNYKLVISDGAN